MTDDLTSIADLAKRAVASGAAGTLCTLFCTSGSMYRPIGSMMVSLAGTQAGGITDHIDEYIMRVGKRLTRSTPSVMGAFRPGG